LPKKEGRKDIKEVTTIESLGVLWYLYIL
jgi:hypothetical protein